MYSRKFNRRRYKRRTAYVWRRQGTQGVNRPALGRMRVMRSAINPKPHSFKRSLIVASNVATSAGINGGLYFGTFSPQLNQLPNVSEFGALYDQYRINYVVYKIIWRSSNLSLIETSNNTNSVGMPYLMYVIDRDDVTVPSTVTTLREYANMRQFTFTPDKRQCTIKFKPNTLQMIYQSNISTSYSVQYKRWVDIADGGTTPYYGCKYAIILPNYSPVVGVAVQAYFDIEATYYFQCRVPR